MVEALGGPGSLVRAFTSVLERERGSCPKKVSWVFGMVEALACAGSLVQAFTRDYKRFTRD